MNDEKIDNDWVCDQCDEVFPEDHECIRVSAGIYVCSAECKIYYLDKL